MKRGGEKGKREASQPQGETTTDLSWKIMENPVQIIFTFLEFES